MSVNTYCSTLSLIWQEMDLCREAVWCACGCVMLHQVEAVDRVYDFLTGLNSQFDGVQARILSQQSIPSLMGVLKSGLRKIVLLQ